MQHLRKLKRSEFKSVSFFQSMMCSALGRPTSNDVVDSKFKLSESELARAESKVIDKNEREESILNVDNLFQMDVSSAPVHDIRKGSRVFWRSVQVVEHPRRSGACKDLLYEVRLDDRRVKAFEGKTGQFLILPSKDYAYAVAREWGAQNNYLNQTVMPLTDIASAASYHVNSSGIPPRVDYLISFLRNDNTFYRAPKIENEQDKIYKPIHDWFEKTFDVKPLPRADKLKYCALPEETATKVHGVLSELNLNTYQIISLCVLCQYTSSLVLPLAHLLTNGALVSTKRLIELSNMEENYNARQHGAVEGYHDFREKELKLKISAAVCAWQLTNGLSVEHCIPE